MSCLTLPVVQHAALKLSLFACHGSVTLSCHVQTVDQQKELTQRLEAMTISADNDHAALLAAQRSVTHRRIYHLPPLLAWFVNCLPCLT